MRILRARQAGTGYGGTGNPKAAPGIMHGTRDDSVGDRDSPAMIRAYAAMREKARKAISGSSIGSKGKL